MTTDKWKFDALAVQLAFVEHDMYGHYGNTVFTQEDADDLEQYCTALMLGVSQMDAGQRKKTMTKNIDFADVPQILNQIACIACHMVLSGAHRKAVTDEVGGAGGIVGE